MLRILFLIVSIIPSFFVAHAQYLPKEGSTLNYRIIGFSVPECKYAQCRIELAEGAFKNIDSFRSKVHQRVSMTDGRAVIEVPKFGKQYTWTVVNIEKTDGAGYVLHHFSTLPFPDSATRLHILKTTQKYADGFVFVH